MPPTSLLRLFNGINESGQTILMVTHSVKAASHAGRVLFIKDGEVFHQLYRGEGTDQELLSAHHRHPNIFLRRAVGRRA